MDETPISLKAAQKTVEAVTAPRYLSESEKLLHTNRLRKEGCWSEFGLRKEEFRTKLLAEGATRKQARDGAWVQAIAELPVVKEPKEPEEPALTDEQIVRLKAASSEIDIRADILFAYNKRWLKGLSVMSFEERPGAYQFWRLGKDNNAKFIELALKYLRQDDEDDASKPDERDVELGDLMTSMEKEFPVEGAKEACPACSAMLQLPNSRRTGDDAKSPEFHLRVA